MLTKIPKGMKDVLPAESARWRAVENECRRAALLAGYREIRTPVLEHTELFARSAGESSDVVRKEMYTFKDKGDRSVTLKPESTAGTVRAFLESGLYAQALPMKMYYINAPHFRYEAPQSGRLREHHQFGMECFGASQPSADAELIVLVVELLSRLGLENLSRAHQFHRLPQLPSRLSAAFQGISERPGGTSCASPARNGGHQPHAHAGLQGSRLQGRAEGRARDDGSPLR